MTVIRITTSATMPRKGHRAARRSFTRIITCRKHGEHILERIDKTEISLGNMNVTCERQIKIECHLCNLKKLKVF